MHTYGSATVQQNIKHKLPVIDLYNGLIWHRHFKILVAGKSILIINMAYKWDIFENMGGGRGVGAGTVTEVTPPRVLKTPVEGTTCPQTMV